MDFLEIAQQRQSTRNYQKDKPVEQEKLDACLQAFRLAPSACNSQPYHATVATGAFSQQVGAATRGLGMNQFTVNVPAFVVITEASYNFTAGAGAKVKGQDYRSVDIGIAAAYLTAQATALGLGSCMLGWFDQKKLQALLKTKKPVRLVIALGYASPEDPLRPKVRRPLEALVSYREE